MKNIPVKKKTISVNTYLLLLIGLVVFIFGKTLFFNFTNWDDPYYVTNNELIKHFNVDFIKQIFTHSFHGHFHPLTWISLSLDYQFFQLKPFGYHLHNLMLHLLNVVLVFYFIRQISSDARIAFFTALLFGIHPFVNESVAWITERKNLLFTFYYLAGMLIYLKYLSSSKPRYYWLTIVSLFLSLLAKGSAITFPLILLALLHLKNQLNRKRILEILPIIAVSVVFAYLAAKAQSPLLAMENQKLSLNQSFGYSSWALWLYSVKGFFPYSFSAYHPLIISTIPFYFYVGIILFLVGTWLFIYSIKEKLKWLTFGLLFFAVNIFMFLKIFDAYASSYFMAERYTYLAYIGLFYAFFTWILPKTAKKNMLKYFLYLWVLMVGFQSFAYADSWKNSANLWKQVLSVYPDNHVALLNGGNALRQEGNYNQAIECYSRILHSDSTFMEAYENRAFAYYKTQQFNLALGDYGYMLQKNPERKDIRQYMVSILLESGAEPLAYKEIKKLLKQDSAFCEAWNSLGNYYLQKNNPDSAVYSYSKALRCNENALFYYNRANVFSQTNQWNEALADYQQAIKLDSSHATYYMNRGITYYEMKNYNTALLDISKAIYMEPANATYYLNRCNVFIALNQRQAAINDLSKAIELNPNAGQAYIKRSYLWEQAGNHVNACSDAQHAIALGLTQFKAWKEKVCK
jgi:tetratricopeptide (TPR) repeat protein